MNIKTILTTTVLAAAGSALVSSANAAPMVYTDGDLFLAFRATGGTGINQTVLVNIGQGTFFRDLAPGSYALNLGNLDADLDATFGTNTWNTRNDLFWGVAGAYQTLGADSNVLFAARKETTIGTTATPWNRAAELSQGNTAALFQNLASGALFDNEGVTGNGSNTIIQNSSDNNDWTEFMAGNSGSTGSQTTTGNAFGRWSSTAFEDSFGNGTAGTRLDLFMMTPGSGAGSYEGTFSINNNGLVTFTVVPEPGSVAMLGLGAGLLGFLRRRKCA